MIAQKIRIYPNKTQRVLLDKFFDYARWCFNEALSSWKTSYSAGKSSTARSVRDELKTKIPTWAPKSSKPVIDTECEHLGAAFENFFSKRAGYPKFKSKKNPKQSFELYRKNDSSIRIRNRKVVAPKGANQDVRGSPILWNHKTFDLFKEQRKILYFYNI